MFIQDFKMAVKKFPNKPAAFYKGEYITYSELDYKSSQLAAYLIKRFGRNSGVIGYYGERSIETLIAILGIWKSGASYLPIEPIIPHERKKIIYKESGVRLLLVDYYDDMSELIECMPISEILSKQQHGQVIEIDTDNAHCDDVAYIIFTSGTTGVPKGAMITHKGMYNHLLAKKEFLDFSEETKLAQTANIGFDISIWQLILPLMLGAAVFFVMENEIMNLKKITNYILKNDIQILEVVPSYLDRWLNYLSNRNIIIPSLKYLFVTGEMFNPNLANRSVQYFKQVKIVNAYGPAEAADDVTHYILDKNIHYDNVPLGSSIPGMQIDILDEQKQPVPMSVKGTIYVTGVGVGKGYINNPDKTAESFHDNLLVTGKCSYDTGDTGYIDEDGLLYYCGRNNNQVKINGHRIELEEIEMRLQLADNIKDAVVEASEELGSLGKKLIAFVVLKCPSKIPTKEYLDTELKKTLPHYMLPKEYYICRYFRLSKNGKIDRTKISEQIISLIS